VTFVTYSILFWFLTVYSPVWLYHFKSSLCYFIFIYIIDGSYFAYTRHEPVGLCGQIIPVSSIYMKYITYRQCLWSIYMHIPGKPGNDTHFHKILINQMYSNERWFSFLQVKVHFRLYISLIIEYTVCFLHYNNCFIFMQENHLIWNWQSKHKIKFDKLYDACHSNMLLKSV
jgi:hypothetical protein